MGSDAELVAERLRDAYRQGSDEGHSAMIDSYAATIELRHSTPHASDGPIDKAVLAAVGRAEIAAARRAMPDLAHEDVDVRTDGDDIHFSAVMRGTMVDGTPVQVQTRVLFTVADGQIIAMEARLDAEAMEQWGKTLRAGGFSADAEGLAAQSAPPE